MRYDVKVTTLSDLQDGDEFEVGNQRWEWRRGQVWTTPNSSWSYLAHALISALGKVSRPIPLPPADEKAPLGYRFATEEDRAKAKIHGTAYWSERLGLWSWNSLLNPWQPGAAYAVPITPAKTEAEAREIPAVGVECEVMDVGCLYHPTIVLPAEFKPGDRVRVVRVQEEVKKG